MSRKPFVLLAVSALGLLVAASGTAAPQGGNAKAVVEERVNVGEKAAADGTAAVARWIEVELTEISSHRLNPPRASRGLALLSVALRNAARVHPKAQQSVMAGAAITVLAYLFPDRRATFEEPAAGQSPIGLALGRLIGVAVVVRARHDGSDAVWRGTPPVGSGLWVPTPQAFAQPLEPLAGTWRTWNIRSGSQFRPGPPPPVGGAAYAQEVREVYDISRTLTDEQKRIASFWSDGAGTATPPGHWNRIALDLIASEGLSAAAAAHVLAALNTAQADAFIACWDAKFTYWSERPVTAIRREHDPAWLSYLPTPPFPSYVSGHSSTSGAASEVLAAYFPAATAQLRAWAEAAAVSRLYGGIHFRIDNDTGLGLGRKIAAAALARYGP